VDKNPLAVDLARLSMWLVTFAKEHPFTFVDHALRCGDSLVGLSKEQISSLSLDLFKGKQLDTVRQVVVPAMTRAEDLRRQIHAIGDPPDIAQLVGLWRDANEALRTVRMLGDLVVAAFFSADSDTVRKKRFDELSGEVTTWLATGQYEGELKGMVADLCGGEKPVTPFHWEIEFPEVFTRENPGFDCLVGNPPYAHKNAIVAGGGRNYIPYFQQGYPRFHGYSDLGTYFLRRAESLVRVTGCWTLLCTNTITEGKARESGLQAVLDAGSTIIAARSRIVWPGVANVVVCAPTVYRGEWSQLVVLDGLEVSAIGSRLAAETSRAPSMLIENKSLSSTGFLTYGRGFVIDPETAANKFAVDPRNREVVKPLLSASDFTDRPDLSPTQCVINFGTRSRVDAEQFRAPYIWLEEHAREDRLTATRADARDRWWLLVGRAERVYEEVSRQGLTHVLANLHMAKHHAFALVPSDVAPEKNVNVFALASRSAFAILQSRVHEAWADRQSSSLRERSSGRRYTTTSCFATFPWPVAPRALSSLMSLERIGEEYSARRHATMLSCCIGLTGLYNRLHDSEDAGEDIDGVRDLHAQMDRAVLDAYDWTDIKPVYDFREQLDESVRLTWAEDTRDDVLARLLELNRVRAEEESKAAPKGEAKAPKKTSKRKGKADEATKNLFGEDDG